MSSQRDNPSSGVLWSIAAWAAAWGVSENTCHSLRRHPKFPPDATIALGTKCVRFRLNRLEEFAELLAAERRPVAEPERLARARAQRDPAARWIKA